MEFLGAQSPLNRICPSSDHQNSTSSLQRTSPQNDKKMGWSSWNKKEKKSCETLQRLIRLLSPLPPSYLVSIHHFAKVDSPDSVEFFQAQVDEEYVASSPYSR